MTPMKKFAFWLQGLALSVALLCIITDTHAASFVVTPRETVNYNDEGFRVSV